MSKRIPILFGFLLVIAAVWMLLTPNKLIHAIMERLDHLGYDLQLHTRVLTEHLKPQNRIAIVDIDDKSLKTEGRWPWSRAKLAKLVTALQEQGAAVIAFDIFFSEQENNIASTLLNELAKRKLLDAGIEHTLKKNLALFDEDRLFAKSLAANQTILALGFLPRAYMENELPSPMLWLSTADNQQLDLIHARGFISNIPLLQQAAKAGGFINIFADHDGIIRRAPLLMVYQNGVYPALSLQAALTYLGEQVSLVTPYYNKTKKLEGIRLGSRFIPTDEKGQVLIPFIGRSYTFPYYSATDILHGKVAKDSLLGKIIFVGTSATGLGDLQSTPIQSPFPGVEVQATLVNGMLENNFSYIPAWTFGANLFLTLLFGSLAACFFPYLGPRTLGILIVVLPPGLLLINNWIWLHSGLILSVLVPVVLILLIAIFNIIYGYLFETRRREHLKEMFGQYVPEKHIDEMLKTSSDYGLRGEDREMSVIFADIRNFTSISEGMPAAELVDLLNTFFTPMTEIIFKHRGTIDKYIGDLIMAFWGAPLKDKHHARHALESALEMQAQVKKLEPLLKNRGWPQIKIGIGINSGMMSVGDMGSRYRRNYTVLGDAVNLSSRVESLTKFYGVDIIATEYSLHHQPKFVFRQLDQVRVKGKKQSVAIYEVICRKSDLTETMQQELLSYHQALDAYFKQQWEIAEQGMQRLNHADPDKKIYSLYLERIQEFKINPPPADWDGVYVHASK